MSKELNRGNMDGVMSKGYGTIPKLVMQHEGLSIEAKAIYAYLASFAGAGDTAYPSVSIMCKHLGISKDRFYSHRKALLDNDFIRVTQHQNEGGWSNNIYTVVSIPCPCFKDTQNKDTQNKDTQNKDTINNSSINNSINNNNNNIPCTKTEEGKTTKPDKTKQPLSEPSSDDYKFNKDSNEYKIALEMTKLILSKKENANIGHINKKKFQNERILIINMNRIQNWCKDIDYMIRLDFKTPKEILELFHWSQNDEFWQPNIQSPKKLREKWDTLEIRKNNDKHTNKNHVVPEQEGDSKYDFYKSII